MAMELYMVIWYVLGRMPVIFYFKKNGCLATIVLIEDVRAHISETVSFNYIALMTFCSRYIVEISTSEV